MQVLKYTLDPTGSVKTLTLPMGSTVLSCKERYDKIVVYVLADWDTSVIENHRFYVAPTRQEVPDWCDASTFIDTVKLSGGALMFHVFAKRS